MKVHLVTTFFLVGTALHSPGANAQSEEKAIERVATTDENNVILSSGQILFNSTDLSVGPNNFPSGLALERTYISASQLSHLGRGHTHNFSVTFFDMPDATLVTVGSRTYSFDPSGQDGSYGKIVANGYDFYPGDGSVIRFSTSNKSSVCPTSGGWCLRATSWDFPNGERVYFYYDFGISGAPKVPRLSQVQSSSGATLRFYQQTQLTADREAPGRIAAFMAQDANCSIGTGVICSPPEKSTEVGYGYSSIRYKNTDYMVLTRFTDVLGKNTLYEYQSPFSLSKVISPLNKTAVAVTYKDYAGFNKTLTPQRVVAVSHKGGTATSYDYAPFKSPSRTRVYITNQMGGKLQFEFKGIGEPNVESDRSQPDYIVNQFNSTEYFKYNSLDQLIQHVQHGGTTISYERDKRNNVLATCTLSKERQGLLCGSDSSDIVQKYSFSGPKDQWECTDHINCNKVISHTDANLGQTIFEWDSSHGGLLSKTRPPDSSGVNPRVSYKYKSITAPDGRTVSVLDYKRTFINSTGYVDEVYGYVSDQFFLIKSIKRVSGLESVQTCRSYDWRGNLISEKVLDSGEC